MELDRRCGVVSGDGRGAAVQGERDCHRKACLVDLGHRLGELVVGQLLSDGSAHEDQVGEVDPVAPIGRMRRSGAEEFEAGGNVALEDGDLREIGIRPHERLESWVVREVDGFVPETLRVVE